MLNSENYKLPKVSLNNLDLEHTFFHFTDESSLDSIAHTGLIKTIGENAKGVEKKKLIFFQNGINNALALCDSWIKYTMQRTYGEKNKNGYYKTDDKDELLKKLDEWYKEFLSREYLNNVIKKNYVFNIIYSKAKEKIYLALDLEEGKDFIYTDIDYNKKSILEKKQKGDINPYLFAKEMYGSSSNIDTEIMDGWNMHTTVDTDRIEPSKLKQITDSKGRTDMLHIAMEMYDKYRDTNMKFDILDDFMQYAKTRQLEEQSKNEGKITFDDIGLGTAQSFKQNTAEAIKVIETLEKDVKQQEQSKEGQTQGES